MDHYAMAEVRDLIGGLRSPLDDRTPAIRYLCALFAELSYYHIPQWEIDNRKRGKLIPCKAYQAIVSGGGNVDLIPLLGGLELPPVFIAVDRGVIAVGMVLKKLLFIGFRGTQFLFDWRINIRVRLSPTVAHFRSRGSFIWTANSGRLHSGFAEEAMRISSRIADAVRDSNLGDFDHVFLSGHLLSGAGNRGTFPGNQAVVAA